MGPVKSNPHFEKGKSGIIGFKDMEEKISLPANV
jgi:hypothetical protein